MQKLLVVVSAVGLFGCANLAVDPSIGRFFTIEHGEAIFSSAMNAANAHCSNKYGVPARHLGTERGGFYMLSRFECTR